MTSAFYKSKMFKNSEINTYIRTNEFLNFLYLQFACEFSPSEGESVFLVLLQFWLHVITQKTVFVLIQTYLAFLAIDFNTTSNFMFDSMC